MAGKEFGKQVRLHREAKEWSRADLERWSGVTESTIENYEGSTPPRRPRRSTVTALARAFGWDVDEALALAGLPALTPEQREVLAVRVDRKAVLDEVWGRLSARQQAAVVELVSAVVEPQGQGVVSSGPAGDPPGDSVVVLDTGLDAGGRVRREQGLNNSS